MRAVCIGLLAVVSLMVSVTPAARDGLARGSRSEARGFDGPDDRAVLASSRRGDEAAKQLRAAALAPPRLVLLAPSRVVVTVEHRLRTASPRLVEITPRSRAPPLATVQVS